ncbi:MAG: YbaK/EbsC family protein [Patescibacteria group bacterium]
MNNVLELSIDLEVIDLPIMAEGEYAEIAHVLDVPVEAIVSITLFRCNGGFLAFITSANRRLNFSAIFGKTKLQWCTVPNVEEMSELGSIDRTNPFLLATNQRVQMIIDAKLLDQKSIIVLLGNHRAIKTTLNHFMVGTMPKIQGGISLPKKFDQ